jgi:hypothetical protein
MSPDAWLEVVIKKESIDAIQMNFYNSNLALLFFFAFFLLFFLLKWKGGI